MHGVKRGKVNFCLFADDLMGRNERKEAEMSQKDRQIKK